MDFALTESQELIRKEVAALARTFSLDYWLEKDDKAEYPREFVKAFADRRLARHHDPRGVRRRRARRHRGRAHAPRDLRLGRGHLRRLARSTSTCFPPTPVIKYGTEALKRKYLPRHRAPARS